MSGSESADGFDAVTNANPILSAAIKKALAERGLAPGATSHDPLRILQPHEDEIVPPTRLTDDIFRTVRDVRNSISKVKGVDHGILIPLEKGIEDEGEMDQLGVPRSLLVALMATARVALRWPKTEGDPVASGVEFANDLLADIPQTDVTLQKLQEKNTLFEGLDPLRADHGLIELLETSLDSLPNEAPSPDQPKKHFYVEQYTNSPEAVHIGAIIRAILARTRDLHGLFGSTSSTNTPLVKAELREWRRWIHCVKPPNELDAQGMQAIYEKVMVPRGDLLALGGMPSAADLAKVKIQNAGGFLHAPSMEEIAIMFQPGYHTFAVKTEDNKPLGYTSVLTDTATVKRKLADMCGYDPSVTYRATNVPKKNARGQKVEWLKRTLAADVLNSADYIAESIEVAVLPNSTEKQLRTTGMATALKFQAYSAALEAQKSNVLVRHFEIIGVNGKRVPGGVMNAASRTFIFALGGDELGTYQETFSPMPGLNLEVLWHMWICDLKEAVDKIQNFNR